VLRHTKALLKNARAQETNNRRQDQRSQAMQRQQHQSKAAGDAINL